MQEDLSLGEMTCRLFLLPTYERALKGQKKKEPRLHELVKDCLKIDLENGQQDEIPGCGGWVKGRVASPSRNIGKSGGYRLIYLFLRIQRNIYLFTVYDHRIKSDLSPEEKKLLKIAADAYRQVEIDKPEGDAK